MGPKDDHATKALGLGVHRLELKQVLVALHGVLLVLLEELLRTLGELAGQTAIARLILEELLIAALRLLGVEGELLAGLGRGVEAEEVPVTSVDSLLHLFLAVHHAALGDGVHLAGAVADDQ